MSPRCNKAGLFTLIFTFYDIKAVKSAALYKQSYVLQAARIYNMRLLEDIVNTRGNTRDRADWLTYILNIKVTEVASYLHRHDRTQWQQGPTKIVGQQVDNVFK